MAGAGFPEVWTPTFQGGAPTYHFAHFSQKLHEIERIWTPGARVLRPPPLDPPLAHQNMEFWYDAGFVSKYKFVAIVFNTKPAAERRPQIEIYKNYLWTLHDTGWSIENTEKYHQKQGYHSKFHLCSSLMEHIIPSSIPVAPWWTQNHFNLGSRFKGGKLVKFETKKKQKEVKVVWLC